MSIHIERTDYDPQIGYQYYVRFTRNGTYEDDEVRGRVPVEVALSLCENGDLADFSFEVPKTLRGDKALEFITPAPNARCVEERVYVTFPGLSGDAVVAAAGRLEVDLAGRIIGLEILWAPVETSS
jgi:hypothetical protein